MTPRQRETFPPVTLSPIGGLGCRHLRVYRESPRRALEDQLLVHAADSTISAGKTKGAFLPRLWYSTSSKPPRCIAQCLHWLMLPIS
jgi:hypothetical protein